MVFVRSSPSGPVVAGQNDVDTLFGRVGVIVPVVGDYSASEVDNDSSVQGAQVSDALDSLNAFDFVINAKSDLPPPSGGVIELTSGSWAINANVDMGTDYIEIPSGVEVLIMGMGNNHELSTNRANLPVIEFLSGSVAQIVNLDLGNRNNSGYGLLVDSDDITIINLGLLGQSNAASNGVRQTGGNITAVACFSFNFGQGWNMLGGEAYLSFHRMSGHDNGLIIQDPVENLSWIGGYIKNISVDGISLRDDAENILLNAIQCEDATDFVDYSAGDIQRMSIVGCLSTTSTAIEWAAASLPVQGLTLGHNTWNGVGSTYQGFTELSARANTKGSITSSGLLAETPIVP